MARSRNIKPGFFHNEDLVELPYECRLLFIGLWCMADREGRLENRPKKIKMQIFPADALDVSEALLGLSKSNLITLYSVDNIEYILIDNFLKHQHPHHKESKSVIPPPVSETSPVKVGADPADSLLPITDSLNPIAESPSKTKVREKITFPEWLDSEAWDEFEQHRKDIKKPLTDLARKKNLSVLEKHQGLQKMIINLTIANRWTGLFEPKGASNGQGNTSKARQFSDKMDDIARRDIEKNGVTESLG